jgi:hypothetical protein
LSSDAMTFAYGGDEVELSVWNTESAFHPRTEDLNKSAAASKKRKRDNELFPGEIWRAKNVGTQIPDTNNWSFEYDPGRERFPRPPTANPDHID